MTNRTEAVRRHDPMLRSFASDNLAGVHPEILDAIALANHGHQPSYGADVYTEHAREIFRQHFGDEAQVYPVFGGTGANVVSLQSVTDRWGGVITADTAHIHIHECGASERIGGIKLFPISAPDGKLTVDLIERETWGFDFVQRVQPQVVSITQATDVGTCYSQAEIAAICAFAHERNMRVHMDGARIANAAAYLGVPLRAITSDVGVDILSFGGTKNGMLNGDAVVVLNPEAVRGVEYLRMSSTQLASKMRFISVQFEALLAGDLWMRNAQHANAMAQRLFVALRDLLELEVLHPVQANMIFAVLPVDVTERLSKDFLFGPWEGHPNAVRWVTAFDTTEADVDAFADAIARELQG